MTNAWGLSMEMTAETHPGLASPAGPKDPIYQSDRTRVTRVRRVDGAAVIVKEPLGPGAEKRLRRERTILGRLAGIDGVAQLASGPRPDDAVQHDDAIQPDGALLIEDAGATSLASLVSTGPMDVAVLLALAPGLASVVAAIHRRGVIHKDITPANIMVSDRPRSLRLIDFDLATMCAEERPAFAPQNEIAGTLAYLAPEQTGHSGRPVDQRADLYGLGATLYELATGSPPFGSGDPLRLIHDHLVRMPTPPHERNVATPVGLSEIIMRLLAKEPDRRYQSAEGLAHDLARLHDAWARGDNTPLALGERDVAVRLSPPSRLIGRELEVNTLRTALSNAVAGRNRGVLISGAPGVGKSMLLDELRPMVAVSGGWFVTGKCDQYRQDQDSDAVRQALRALGRLLLAEPEDEVVRLRARVLGCLGANAGLIAAVLPEFAMLLDVPPEAAEVDPLTMQVRLQQAGLDLLRAVASPQRPVVLALDDLQWATPTQIGLIDAVLGDGDLHGVLLVGAYRDADVDAARPLTAMLSRWQRLDLMPTMLRLVNLPAAALSTMVGEMLRISAHEAAPLADAIAARTGGNPFDTLELVNALRRDGTLTAGAHGWQWDPSALRQHIGQGDVIDLLNARLDALPPTTTTILEIIAYLGGEVEIDLLSVASDLSAQEVDERLLPALRDGLLGLDHASDSVRFRHDRVHEAMLGRQTPELPGERRLTLARRLAAVPRLEIFAAEQYLHAVDAVRTPAERRQIVELFRAAARQGGLLANYALVERFVAAALELLTNDDLESAEPVNPDASTLAELMTERHAALCSLGRLDDADEVYRATDELSVGALALADITCMQVNSLTSRGRPQDAVALGLDQLRRLGTAAPTDPQGLGADIGAGMEALYRWVADDHAADDLGRAEIDDPQVLAIAKTINRLIPPAFFCDQATMAWLVVESGRMWAQHGPAPALIGPLSHAAFVTSALRADYRTGEIVVRRVVALGDARGYEPDTSQARFLYALGTGHWFEPLEDNVRQARQAREGLIRGGDLINACFTYYVSVAESIDCAPTLDACLAEVDAALAFAARVGLDQSAAAYVAYRQLIRAMRGETEELGGFSDSTFDETAHLAGLATNPTAAANFHVARAMAAAIFGDSTALIRHAAAAMPVLLFVHATYPTAPAHVLQALALAGQIRTAAADERSQLLTELDTCRDWLAARAEDAPGNFRHLLGLVEAERAWAVDDFRAATVAYDAALRDVAPRRRPWHRALIAERAAMFHLAHGLEHVGHTLLGEARRSYDAWGATAKVTDLDWRYPMLPTLGAIAKSDLTPRRAVESRRAMMISADEVDVLGILEASQALSSETNLERLQASVTAILSAMTGATAVRIMLYDDEAGGWFLPGHGENDDAPTSVEQAAQQGILPLSAFRYVERTREPLVVEDATRDDRFSRDPYFADLDCCSLLVAPILTRGEPKAVLVLENRLSRTAFSPDRLDGVMLLAGQLSVSLDNALLYASLERKVADRTTALAVANERLEALSLTDPLTGLANRHRLTDVLDHEWRRALRPRLPIAVAMIDIDHFKLYNDRYGHPAGDQCLRRVAAVLNECVRSTDLVARYGGEEFAIVLPSADATVARQVAQRVRDAVMALDQPHERSPYGVVTVSIGLAVVIPSEPDTPEHLIELADHQLYLAKHNGRNQVMAQQGD
jgi:diguanylate cyclase (GGDEF)-like protein